MDDNHNKSDKTIRFDDDDDEEKFFGSKGRAWT